MTVPAIAILLLAVVAEIANASNVIGNTTSNEGSCPLNDTVVFPSSNDVTSQSLVAGAALSFISCAVIIVAYVCKKSLRRQPNSLILLKTICDLFFVSFLFHSFETSNHDSDCSSGLSFAIALFWAGSEFCFICVAVDLLLNLRSPFIKLEQRNWLYRFVVVLGSIGAAAVLVMAGKPGIWITGFCLTDYCASRSMNAGFVIGALCPIIAGILSGMFVLVYSRLNVIGWSIDNSKAWEPRNQMIRLTTYYTMAYTIYWFITLVCIYLTLYLGIKALSDEELWELAELRIDSNVHMSSGVHRVQTYERLFVFCLGAKAAPTLIVWIFTWANQAGVLKIFSSGLALHDLKKTVTAVDPFADASLAPDMNAALRKNLVDYLEVGLSNLSSSAWLTTAEEDVPTVRLRPAESPAIVTWSQRLCGTGQHVSARDARSKRVVSSMGSNLLDGESAATKETPSDLDLGPGGSGRSSIMGMHALIVAAEGEAYAATVTARFETHFRKIREVICPQKDYERSLRHINPGKVTEGRSGAFLFFTKDQKLMLKTVTPVELEVLRSMLEDIPVPDDKHVQDAGRTRAARSQSIGIAADTADMDSMLTYTEYLQKHRHQSLIVKIIGCVSLTLHEYGNEKVHFIVQMNVFPPKPRKTSNGLTPGVTIDEEYDLKGSWIKRAASLPKVGSKYMCKHCHRNFTYHGGTGFKGRKSDQLGRAVSLSADQRRRQQEAPCQSSRLNHEPVQTFKDNDMRRKIFLPSAQVKELKTRIERDVMWFQAHAIMDYSLLLGVVRGRYRVMEEARAPAINSNNATATAAAAAASNGSGDGDDNSRDRAETCETKYCVRIASGRSLRDLNTESLESMGVLPTASLAESAVLPDLIPIHSPASSKPSPAAAAAADADMKSPFLVRHVREVEGPHTYYMGIIDILQKYDLYKRGERLVKTRIYGQEKEGISCIDPVQYAHRYLLAMERMIASDTIDDA